MSRNRPINRRPFRRPPWRKKPVRWVDANSAALEPTEFNLGVGSITPPGTGGIATVNYRELVVGDIDTGWSDNQDVVLERLVGDISIMQRHLSGPLTDISNDSLLSGALRVFPIVRMGIVLLEDEDETATPSPPGLWTADDLRDGEWLWLKQWNSLENSHCYLDEPNGTLLRIGSLDIHLDLRVKRKIGRRDRLVLCHEYAQVGETFEGTHAIDVQPLLRALVSTK